MRGFFLILVFLYSCSSEKKHQLIPKDLIGEDQIINLLFEIELTQAYMKIGLSPIDSIDQGAVYHNVFRKFNVTPKRF